jgi:hypothetical protein
VNERKTRKTAEAAEEGAEDAERYEAGAMAKAFSANLCAPPRPLRLILTGPKPVSIMDLS